MVQSPLGLSVAASADEPLYRQIFDQVVDRLDLPAVVAAVNGFQIVPKDQP
jgi:hypothetical protein